MMRPVMAWYHPPNFLSFLLLSRCLEEESIQIERFQQGFEKGQQERQHWRLDVVVCGHVVVIVPALPTFVSFPRYHNRY